MPPSNRDAAIGYPGLSRGVRDALADPIVQALLAADHVDPQEVADLARRVAARLCAANPAPEVRAPGRGSSADLFDCN
jgi:hypothetical protein